MAKDPKSMESLFHLMFSLQYQLGLDMGHRSVLIGSVPFDVGNSVSGLCVIPPLAPLPWQ